MNKTEENVFKKLLLEERSELNSFADATNEATQPVILDQASVGRLSRMDAMQAQNMAQEVARRRALQLIRIEGALRRIEADDFGYCYVCGEDIDVRRLKVDPTSTKCVTCISEK